MNGSPYHSVVERFVKGEWERRRGKGGGWRARTEMNGSPYHSVVERFFKGEWERLRGKGGGWRARTEMNGSPYHSVVKSGDRWTEEERKCLRGESVVLDMIV